MKLSLGPVLSSLLLLAACSSDPAPPPGPANDPIATPSAPPPASAPAPPPARTLVQKPLALTAPENLVHDPEFQSLWTALDETGFGIYESFVQDGEHTVAFLPKTPVGAGGATLEVKPGSESAQLTMTVRGGDGPLTARVWVATNAGEAAPEIELVSIYDAKSVVLAPDASAKKTIDGMDWVLLTGTSTDAMPGMLYLVATVAHPARFVAPQVLSAALAPMKTRSIESARRAPGRASAKALRAARAFDDFRARHVTYRLPPPPVKGQIDLRR